MTNEMLLPGKKNQQCLQPCLQLQLNRAMESGRPRRLCAAKRECLVWSSQLNRRTSQRIVTPGHVTRLPLIPEPKLPTARLSTSR